MATSPCFGDGDDMNASLWGELQSFIDISLIYAKLPLAPFFRLRQVCKEWNRLASNRQFLEQNFKPPISKLYFVVARGTGHRLWTSQDSLWTSSPLPQKRCEVSGLLYEDSDRQRVFDLHTRVFYSLPPLPSGKLVGNGSIVGMAVDTALIPYGFRVFITEISGTSVYDSSSGAWTTPTSSNNRVGFGIRSKLSSIHYKEILYMQLKDYRVETYDLQKHVWHYHMFEISRYIGVWQDRWFAFRMKPDWNFTAWQMNTRFEKRTVFDCMPKDLCKWMMRGLEHQSVVSTFCGEHVLLSTCLEEAEERAVLYNLDQKTWNKVAPQQNPLGSKISDRSHPIKINTIRTIVD